MRLLTAPLGFVILLASFCGCLVGMVGVLSLMALGTVLGLAAAVLRGDWPEQVARLRSR